MQAYITSLSSSIALQAWYPIFFFVTPFTVLVQSFEFVNMKFTSSILLLELVSLACAYLATTTASAPDPLRVLKYHHH